MQGIGQGFESPHLHKERDQDSGAGGQKMIELSKVSGVDRKVEDRKVRKDQKRTLTTEYNM